MFLTSMVLPTPLGPSRMRFLPSRRKSSATARASRGRSIFLGQFQSKWASGLKVPRRLVTVRRSSERRERSAVSVAAMCSSKARGPRRRWVAVASRSSRAAAVAYRPRARSWLARSFIVVLRCGLGELVIGRQRVRLDVQGGELGAGGQVDGQRRGALGRAGGGFRAGAVAVPGGGDWGGRGGPGRARGPWGGAD